MSNEGIRNQERKEGSFYVVEFHRLFQGFEDLSSVLYMTHLVLNFGAIDIVQGMLS
jgi:hypothetical protein